MTVSDAFSGALNIAPNFRLMRHWMGAALLLLGSAQLASADTKDCERGHDPRYTYAATIVEVYDGDTIYVDIDLGFRKWIHREPLRLWGVNTPELRGENKIAGLEVRDLVSSWLPVGTEVLLRTLKDKHGGDRTGSFHRYLAIICPEGWSKSLNARLLATGNADIQAGSNKERERVLTYFEISDVVN